MVRKLLKWSGDLKKPLAEDKLQSLFQAQVVDFAPKKGPPLDSAAVIAATWDDILVDNSRRVESEVLAVCEDIRKRFSKDSRLAELKTLRPAVFFDDIIRMKDACRVSGEEVIDKYMRAVAPTRDLIDLEAAINSQEAALLDLYRAKELRGLADLDAAMERETAACEDTLLRLTQADPNICLHMGETVQSACAQCSAVVIERLCAAFGPLPALLQESFKSTINQRCVQFLINQLIPSFTEELKRLFWRENYTVRPKQPFEQCEESTRATIAIVALQLKQPATEQSVTEVISHLRPQAYPEVSTETLMQEFRANLTIVEKCRLLLGLGAVLSGTHQTNPEASGSQLMYYNPVRRQLFRDIVNSVFGTGSIPVFNDWLLARCAEQVIATKQAAAEPPPLPLSSTSTKEVHVKISTPLSGAKAFAKKWYSRASDLLLVGTR